MKAKLAAEHYFLFIRVKLKLSSSHLYGDDSIEKQKPDSLCFTSDASSIYLYEYFGLSMSESFAIRVITEVFKMTILKIRSGN